MLIKIFDEDVEACLRDLGVSQAEIATIKFKELKKSTVATLKMVAHLVENDLYDKVRDLLAYSPRGDDMGCDNYYISFAELIGKDDADGADINYIITLLERLKEEANAFGQDTE